MAQARSQATRERASSAKPAAPRANISRSYILASRHSSPGHPDDVAWLCRLGAKRAMRTSCGGHKGRINAGSRSSPGAEEEKAAPCGAAFPAKRWCFGGRLVTLSPGQNPEPDVIDVGTASSEPRTRALDIRSPPFSC